MTCVLEARSLAKTYDTGGAKVLALRGIDLTIERGEFVAVMGPTTAVSPWHLLVSARASSAPTLPWR